MNTTPPNLSAKVYFRKKRLVQYPKKGRYEVLVFDTMEDAVTVNAIEVEPEILEAYVRVLGTVQTHNVFNPREEPKSEAAPT